MSQTQAEEPVLSTMDDKSPMMEDTSFLKRKKDKLVIGDYSVDQNDLYSVGDAELDDKGLVHHHISSADDLYTTGIPQIITQVFKVEKDIANQRDSTPEDKLIDRIHVLIKFTDVFISRPTTINYFSGKEEVLYPNVALLKDKTYSGNLRINASITATAYFKNGSTKVRTDEIKNFKLCRVPVMVRSVLCNTHGLSKEALMRMHEDPTDPGGYFIIKGIEWVIDCIENILFNQIRVFKNEGYSKEVERIEFVSKPGDTYQNSDYFLVRLLIDNQLNCEIVRNNLKGLQIPFFLLFRVLGWGSDKEMFDNIIYGYDDDISKNMLNYVVDSLNAKYSSINTGRHTYAQTEVLKLIVDEIKYTEFKYLELDTKPENYQIAYNKIFNILDLHFLPHIGMVPEDRPKKLRYLALIIRKLFLVKMGNMEPTDRDSYKSKRIHAAGTSYAKSFKTYFNASIIQQIKRRLVKDFKSMSFSQVDLASSVKSSVYGADFERSIMQTITSGNKSQITVNKKARTNRLSSQLLDRKNQIAVYSTLRQVTTTSTESSKQSERANVMRRVHMSFLGYICIIHSSDGEKVGINKQLAIFSSILGATSSIVIKDILLRDKSVIAIDDTSPSMIHTEQLRNVYVNGEWIGCVKDSLELVKKYRKMRRDFEINPLTTIYWDNTQDEAFFWVDVGRPVRPLIIVYNNKRDPDKFSTALAYKKDKKTKRGNFVQGIGVSQDIINKLKTKEIDMEYLIANNIVEYITPEEQENCYLCPYYDQLKDDINNELHEYTHCDIPQAILGLTALTSPFANHNQTPRITFQTSQCKQTCGIFTLNWPFRCDKDTFLQYICETPLVKTVASKYIFPNGSNAIVAIACYTGYNQEDSLVVSQGAVDRGLFNGSKFTFEKTELEQREEFGNPDIATTADIKAGSYAKLKDGLIQKGTKIEKGDAIIGKYARIPKTTDQNMSMSDRSIIYKGVESAIVHNVISDRNEDDERFCKVALRKPRPVAVGDKFCLTPDHEVMTDEGWKNITQIRETDYVATLNQDTHIIEFRQPTELHRFNHDGQLYSVKNWGVDLVTTLNHKMYIKYQNSDKYKLTEAKNIIHNQTGVYYKKTGYNHQPDADEFVLPGFINIGSGRSADTLIHDKVLDMNTWIKFFGIYLAHGATVRDKYVSINITNPLINTMLLEVLHDLGYDYSIYETHPNFMYVTNKQLATYLAEYEDINMRTLPEWCFSLSRNQSSLLLHYIMLCIADCSYRSYWVAQTQSKSFAGAIQCLAIMSDRVAKVEEHSLNDNKFYKIYIMNANHKQYTEPLVKADAEQLVSYTGPVYCITVPNNVFMVRRNGINVWTGNSSRAGQKGVTGILLRDSDMPFTEDGIRPSIIMNPHAIPSRMTIGQLYEMQTANWCAMKGTTSDATIFKYVDIESMAEELEALGMHRYGYHRLYSGITGEYMDALIFMGPTYYQRLQKFVIDTVYSISQGPSDGLSHQPLDGKASGGGIRIGEIDLVSVIIKVMASLFVAGDTFKLRGHLNCYAC